MNRKNRSEEKEKLKKKRKIAIEERERERKKSEQDKQHSHHSSYELEWTIQLSTARSIMNTLRNSVSLSAFASSFFVCRCCCCSECNMCAFSLLTYAYTHSFAVRTHTQTIFAHHAGQIPRYISLCSNCRLYKLLLHMRHDTNTKPARNVCPVDTKTQTNG